MLTWRETQLDSHRALSLGLMGYLGSSPRRAPWEIPLASAVTGEC
jgi:hypothetical protein